MTTVLAGGLFLEPGHPGAMEARRRHRLANPDHVRAKKIALVKGWRRFRLPPPWLDAGMILPPPHPWAGGVALPRRGLLEDLGDPVDCRSSPPAPGLPLELELRPYQARALAAWAHDEEGLVVAPCGSGKTVIGLAAIARTPSPALVLVHTRDLVHQWAERAHDALGLDPVVCAEGSRPLTGRLVVATIQTAVTWPFWDRHAWGKAFGLVVVDECHHVPAATVSEVLLSLPARRRLGLSATPERQDGLTPILHWHLGPTAAAIAQEDLLEAGVVIAPAVVPVRTGYRARLGDEWGTMLSTLVTDHRRTELAADLAVRLAAEGRQVLVLTERVSHAGELAELVRARGVRAAALHGDLGARERREHLEDAAAGSLRVLVATQLADEGLDLPALSALVLTCPQRATGRLRQRVGRIARPAPGKRDAIVLDLVDDGWLARLWGPRSRLYRELGCEVRGAA